MKYLEGKWVRDGVLLHYGWTPWPESQARKMQISGKLPNSDIKKGLGSYHARHREVMTLEEDRKELLGFGRRFDLASLFELVDGSRGKELPPSDVLALHTVFRETGLAAPAPQLSSADWRSWKSSTAAVPGCNASSNLL